MKVLELFAGTRSIGKAFERAGVPREDILSVEIDTQHRDIDWYKDIMTIETQDVLDYFGGEVPDVIWASPPCQSFSIAAISHHRTRGDDGYLYPKSDFAKQSDALLQHTLKLIANLEAIAEISRGKPLYWFIENPRGGMRKSIYMRGLPRYTVTYCQYGDTRMKPTDIWTNHPDPEFKPMCHNGDSCHDRAPRGSKTGTQGLDGSVERSRIPDGFCDHVASICKEMIE